MKKKNYEKKYICIQPVEFNCTEFYRVLTWYGFERGCEYLVPRILFDIRWTHRQLEPYKISYSLANFLY